jgi:hypothetical protein
VLQWAARACHAGDAFGSTPSAGLQVPGQGHRDADPLGVDNLDSLFEDLPSPPLPAPQAAAATPSSPSPEPVASMLRSFVEEFQQLARDWGSVDDASSEAS